MIKWSSRSWVVGGAEGPSNHPTRFENALLSSCDREKILVGGPKKFFFSGSGSGSSVQKFRKCSAHFQTSWIGNYYRGGHTMYKPLCASSNFKFWRRTPFCKSQKIVKIKFCFDYISQILMIWKSFQIKSCLWGCFATFWYIKHVNPINMKEVRSWQNRPKFFSPIDFFCE